MNRDTPSQNSQEILSTQPTNPYWLVGWPYRDRIKVQIFLSGDYKKM